MKNTLPIFFLMGVLSYSCKNTNEQTGEETATPEAGTFAYDLDFLKKHTDAILLTAPDNPFAQVAVCGAYQGRVMTSTAGGEAGNSYGWLNYALISGEKGYQPHINAYGGEDRFWIAPEGGQFSVFFPKGAPFEFDSWQTPGLIDTAHYELISATQSQAVFQKKAVLENYSGTRFEIEINRKIKVMGGGEIAADLGLEAEALTGLRMVGIETENTLTNTGPDWSKQTGTLGIWILSMFTPSDSTTIVAPFTRARSKELQLTDDYFGKVPADRLVAGDSVLFFKGDGKLRSKIGIAPASAKSVAGSYSAEKGILTIAQFDLDPAGDYLKSTWQLHDDPYGGDAFNSYNDGPVDGGDQLGPFYEIESTSPAPALKNGEKLTHRHRVFHFEGDQAALDRVAKTVLGVGLTEILNGGI